MSSFSVGQVVEHKQMQELGRARVEAVSEDNIHLLFERGLSGGSKMFRLPNDHLLLAEDQSLTEFPVTQPVATGRKKARVAAKQAIAAWGFDEALRRFKGKYAGGFADPNYLKKERDSKDKALAQWRSSFGPQALAAFRSKGDPVELAKAFEQVFKVNQLINIPGEWLPFKRAVEASKQAAGLAEAYAGVIAEGAFTEAGFLKVQAAFEAVGMASPKWTLFTYWPFVASQKGFAFVKPTVTKAAAEGLNITLNYTPAVNWATYQACVTVYNTLWEKLEPLGARDWVDVQSFVLTGWGK